MMARPASNRASEPNESGRLLSIGQVLTRLVADFPDVTPSKVRFLEDQGLVTPQRTESGYRKFSAADVDRLQLVLTLQRDHYLPLKVIRGYLEDIDQGAVPLLPGIATAVPRGGDHQRAYTRDELIEVTGADAGLVRDAVSAGLLPIGARFDEGARQVLDTLVALQRHGIDPRHLRGVKATIDREIGLIESATSGIRRDEPSSRARAVSEAAAIADLLIEVKRRLLARGLEHLAD